MILPQAAIRWSTIGPAVLLCCWTGSPLAAQGQTTLPSLAAIDRATQVLFRDVQSHVVRVQVPVRIPADHPLVKWRAQLDPKLRESLDAAHARGESPRLYVEPSTTQPVQGSPDAGHIPITVPTATVNVECVGMVLSPRGDVLLPLFVDPAYADTLQVSVDDRDAVPARVVATDRKTGLTIARVTPSSASGHEPAPVMKPVRLASSRPASGATVVMMSLTRRSARLALWSGGQDESGLLFTSSGELAGIVRNGHTLYPSTFMPIVQQLLTTGEVRRATLGITIGEIPLDDPQRLKFRALGARTAVQVIEVQPDSAAARAGLERGDVILALAGEPVTDTPTFAAALGNRRGRTELAILRDGRPQQVVVELQVPEND